MNIKYDIINRMDENISIFFLLFIFNMQVPLTVDMCIFSTMCELSWFEWSVYYIMVVTTHSGVSHGGYIGGN